MIAWRYASAEDVERYYGEKQALTMRAVILCEDDQPMGIIGLARERHYDRMFSEYKPEFQGLKSMTTLRAIKAAMQMARQSPRPVIAVAENTALLERLGFEQLDGEVYQWRR